jgi:hypothetical protein
MSDLNYSPNGPYQTDDGVNVGLYSVEPEEHESGALISIGVFCHEFGHVLGLPDLYDYDYDAAGVGLWCLMAAGSWGGDYHSPETPVHASAFCKYLLGWTQPQTITIDTAGITVAAAETNSQSYRFVESGPEYFLIENRQKTGFDLNLPGAGLLVWHIDESMPDNDHQCTEDECALHYMAALEQADGRMDMDFNHNEGDAADPYPGTTINRVFDTASQPKSWNYSGIPTWIGLNSISDSSALMSLDVSVSPTIPFFIYQSQSVANDDDSDGIPDAGETFDLYVDILNSGLPITSVAGSLTADSTVQILDGSAVYGDFAGNEEKDNAGDAFRISIPSGTARGTRAQFTLALTGTSRYDQQLSFEVTLAPLPLETKPSWKGQSAYSLAGISGDINGDTFPDLVVANYMIPSKIYWNTGSGLNTAPGWAASDSGDLFVPAVRIVDIAGDGFPEILFINNSFSMDYEFGPASSTLYLNTTGTPETTAGWSSQVHLAVGGACGDIDGDSIPDVILACSEEPNVAYRGLASGTFETAPFWTSSDTLDSSAVALSDIDLDGDLDAVFARAGTPLSVYKNNAGVLETMPSWNSTASLMAMSVTAGDIDLDGYPDFAVGCFGDPALLFRNVAGTLESQPSWQSQESGTPYCIIFGDVDGDLFPELALPDLDLSGDMPSGLPNRIYYNDHGSLATESSWISDTSMATMGAGFADFDGDRDRDFYSVNFNARPEVFTNTTPEYEICSGFGIMLYMPSHTFTQGSPCSLTAILCNPGPELTQYPVFVLLEVYGKYWCAPSFISIDTSIDYYTLNIAPGRMEIGVIPEFIWPDVEGAASGLHFYAAITNPQISELVSNIAEWEFGYN